MAMYPCSCVEFSPRFAEQAVNLTSLKVHAGAMGQGLDPLRYTGESVGPRRGESGQGLAHRMGLWRNNHWYASTKRPGRRTRSRWYWHDDCGSRRYVGAQRRRAVGTIKNRGLPGTVKYVRSGNLHMLEVTPRRGWVHLTPQRRMVQACCASSGPCADINLPLQPCYNSYCDNRPGRGTLEEPCRV